MSWIAIGKCCVVKRGKDTVRELARTLFERWPASRNWAWRAGRAIYCLARGDGQRNAIATNGEAYIQACVVRAVEERTELSAADIGANQGEWTLSLLAAGRAAGRANIKVNLFEPVPTTLARLNQALERAGAATRAAVNALAISNEAGKVRIAVMSTTGGTNSLHVDPGAGAPPGGWIDIDCTTLTRFCQEKNIAHLHLVKCDAEGHDLLALRGALDLFHQNRIDVFQFEYNHRWVLSRTFLKDVFDAVARLPYHVGRVCPGEIEVYSQWHPELDRFFEANYVLVHDNALQWFDVRMGGFDELNTFRGLKRVRTAPGPSVKTA